MDNKISVFNKIIFIITIIFVSASIGALIGGLSQLLSNKNNYKIYFIIGGVIGGVSIILILIMAVNYFRQKRK